MMIRLGPLVGWTGGAISIGVAVGEWHEVEFQFGGWPSVRIAVAVTIGRSPRKLRREEHPQSVRV